MENIKVKSSEMRKRDLNKTAQRASPIWTMGIDRARNKKAVQRNMLSFIAFISLVTLWPPSQKKFRGLRRSPWILTIALVCC